MTNPNSSSLNSPQKKSLIWVKFGVIVLLFLILAVDESVDTVILESIKESWRGIGSLVLVALSMPFALFLAGWSDFHCRRFTIILTLSGIIASCLLIVIYNKTGLDWIAMLALAVKAIIGNAVPIALAILADIVSMKNFRSILAAAIISISLGIWLPIYLRPNPSQNFQLSLYALIICIIAGILTILFLRDDKFDKVKFKKNPINLEAFTFFFKKECKLIIKFFCIPFIALALIGFLFSEASYYQFLLRGEILKKSTYFSSQSLVLAIGYYLGSFILISFDLINRFVIRRNPIKDRTWVILGLIISVVTIALITLSGYTSLGKNLYYIILTILFSLGFAFFVPTIFTAISRTRASEDQGKIFGALDSTDSLSTLLSYGVIETTKTISRKSIFLITSSLFFISFIAYIGFIKLLKKIKIRRQ